MGKLVKGKWVVEDVNPKSEDGEFVRQEQSFRSVISEKGEFKAEADRYHLYVSYACPWAHRALIMRELKGLQDLVSVSVVSPNMMDEGWTFRQDFEGSTRDHLYNFELLSQIYTMSQPDFTGKVTVPVLFDKKLKKIVNNESSEVIRIFNSAFNDLTGNQKDYFPSMLKHEIEQINGDVYENVNNGVYKCGFARTQNAYDHNVRRLFSTLDMLDKKLEGKNYLVGDQLTEADIRLFTTLVRFDSVYYLHFKCNAKQIREYKNLSQYLKGLFSQDPFKSTTHFSHIKQHYYYSHKNLNPYQIVPWGPLYEI